VSAKCESGNAQTQKLRVSIFDNRKILTLFFSSRLTLALALSLFCGYCY